MQNCAICNLWLFWIENMCCCTLVYSASRNNVAVMGSAVQEIDLFGSQELETVFEGDIKNVFVTDRADFKSADEKSDGVVVMMYSYTSFVTYYTHTHTQTHTHYTIDTQTHTCRRTHAHAPWKCKGFTSQDNFYSLVRRQLVESLKILFHYFCMCDITDNAHV